MRKKFIKTIMRSTPQSLDDSVNHYLENADFDLDEYFVEFHFVKYHYKHSVMMVFTKKKELIQTVPNFYCSGK